MREGFEVISHNSFVGKNCVIVSNYFGLNRVENYPMDINIVYFLKNKYDIGVWKIKQLKN